MKATEIRNRNGSYTKMALKVDRAVANALEPIYDVYKKELHPDSIHHIIASNSHVHSIMIIALESFEK